MNLCTVKLLNFKRLPNRTFVFFNTNRHFLTSIRVFLDDFYIFWLFMFKIIQYYSETLEFLKSRNPNLFNILFHLSDDLNFELFLMSLVRYYRKILGVSLYLIRFYFDVKILKNKNWTIFKNLFSHLNFEPIGLTLGHLVQYLYPSRFDMWNYL